MAMEALWNKAKELLSAGTAKVVIGYGKGTGEARRPIFVRSADKVERVGVAGLGSAEPERGKAWKPSQGFYPDDLVLDTACTQNLATYLTKAEVRAMGRMAIVAVPSTLRSILQLAAERQLREEQVLALAVLDGQLKELSTFDAIEEATATIPDALSAADQQMLDKLTAMSVGERRAFWAAELNRCVKCYACRSSCPMCYCERCTMDCNRPQWIPVASHALGNLEYHVVRAMHLAGRCVQCGTCGSACPVGIPVHLLTFFAEGTVRRQFGQKGGASAKLDYAMSTFKPDDKETFIR
jgi:formate dehydrogenase subunit beta